MLLHAWLVTNVITVASRSVPLLPVACCGIPLHCWAEAPIKIARMTLTIKLDGNWSSFQLANCAPPLGVTDSAIAPSARMLDVLQGPKSKQGKKRGTCLSSPFGSLTLIPPLSTKQHQATPGNTRHHQAAPLSTTRGNHAYNSTLELLGLCSPAKIERFTLMRPIHGNL